MKKKFFIKGFIGALGVFSTAFGWPLKEGGLFFSPTYYYYQTSHYWDNNGNTRSIGCNFIKKEINFYSEYGMTDNFTLTAQTAYDELRCGTNSTSGLYDIELGGIYSVFNYGNSAFGIGGKAIIPTGYSIYKPLRLGYDRFGIEPSLYYFFSNNTGYISSSLGYRFYQGYPSDQVRFSINAGLNIIRYLTLEPFINGQIGVGNGYNKNIGNNYLLEPSYKLIQVGLNIIPHIGNISPFFGITKPVYGENTGQGIEYSGGIWFNF